MQLLKYAFTLLSFSTAYITHSTASPRGGGGGVGEVSPLLSCFPSDGLDMMCAAGQIIHDK